MLADVSCKVDVEIVHHAHPREGSPAPMRNPLRTVSSYIHHLHRTSESTPESVEQPREGIQHAVVLGGAERQMEPVATEISTEEAATVTHAEGERDNEEGWVSEDTGDGAIASSSVAQGERRKRVRSSKHKAAAQPPSTGLDEEGRRRLSASDQGYVSSHVSSPSSDTMPSLSPVTSEPEQAQDVPQDVERRGRSKHHERKGSNFSPRSSIQHRRLESLRLVQHARDASPSRSIRFADEHRSGTSTPRNGVLPNES